MDASELAWYHQNTLLRLLPKSDLLHLAPLMTLRETPQKEVLVVQGNPIRHIDFPCNCIYSMVLTMANGNMVEIGTVGNEGVTPLGALLDGRLATATHLCQIPGISLRMTSDDFQREMENNPGFRLIMRLYGQAFLAQMEQSVACNKLHSLDQRTARWLLMTHDRVGHNEFPLTQEFLASMLGAQRPSVTLAAQRLEQAGALAYTRGRLRILDRRFLEETSCECYAATRRQFERLLGVRTG